MYHYVYKLIHLETNEYYIGSRTSSVHPSLDSYLGSMRSWKPEKNKLKKEIIDDSFLTRNDAMEYEGKLIMENISNPLNRNYHIPNIGYHTVGMVTVRDKDGNTFNVNKFDERLLSGELVSVIANTVYLTCIETNNTIRVQKSKIDDYLLSGKYRIGRRITPKMYNTYFKYGKNREKDFQKGEKNSQYGTIWITNEKENKKIKKNEVIPYGWRKGCINFTMNGYKWITNGVENKKLKKNELLPDGWKIGYKTKE